MQNEPQIGDLRPRAIAVLLALRPCSLPMSTISRYIGDPRAPRGTRPAIEALVKEMASYGLVKLSVDVVTLAHDGIAWLESHGLKAEYVP